MLTFWDRLKARHKRFFLTMISKRIFAWFVGTTFFYKGMLSADQWILFTCAVFGMDLYQKIKGLDAMVPNKRETDRN